MKDSKLEKAPLLAGDKVPLLSSSAIEVVARAGAPPASLAPAAASASEPNQEREQPAASPDLQLSAAAGVPWGVTACLLLADMLGIGALSLPSVFARLGWIFSFSLLTLFSIGCGYLGVLFTRLGVALPNATAFDEIGEAAMGKLGKRLVYLCAYLTIFVDPVILQLTCVLSLRRVFTGLSDLAAGIIVAVIMVPLGQIQSIGDIGFVSIIATVGMIMALGICLFKMLLLPGNKMDETSMTLPAETGFVTAIVAAMNCAFAFGGQVNWLRYESAMETRQDFKHAVEVADVVMMVVYVLLASVGYYKLGTSFDLTKPVTSVLPQDSWVQLMNLALFVRCVIAYVINLNVWTDMVIRVSPSAAKEALQRLYPQQGQRLLWGVLSVAGIFFSFLVAYCVPFFSTILALIAAFGVVAAPYTLPALFSLVLLKGELPNWERWLLRAIIPVSGVFAAAGVGAAIAEMLALFKASS